MSNKNKDLLFDFLVVVIVSV